MMMMIKRFFCFLFFLLYTVSVYGQENDFGLWYEINAKKSITKKFDISGNITLRTFDNASKIDQAFFELGASYSLNKHVDFSLGYRIGNYVEDDYLYHIRNKFMADVKGSLPFGRLVFSARMRFQASARTYIEDENDDRAEYDGRLRVKAVYKIPDFPVNPYLTFETFSPLFSDKDRLIEKSRTSAGLEFKLSKKHSIEAEYMYQRDNIPRLSVMHIIAFNYTFKF